MRVVILRLPVSDTDQPVIVMPNGSTRTVYGTPRKFINSAEPDPRGSFAAHLLADELAELLHCRVHIEGLPDVAKVADPEFIRKRLRKALQNGTEPYSDWDDEDAEEAA